MKYDRVISIPITKEQLEKLTRNVPNGMTRASFLRTFIDTIIEGLPKWSKKYNSVFIVLKAYYSTFIPMYTNVVIVVEG